MNKLLISAATMRDDARLGCVTIVESLQRLGSYFLCRFKDTLSDWRALSSIFLLVSIVSLSAVGGYVLGQKSTNTQHGLVIIPASFANDRPALAMPSDQSGTIQRTLAPVGADVVEITNQLGSLRAELLRLHTVFVQLIEQAELDDGEFDLQPPFFEWQELSNVEQIGLLKRRIAHISSSAETLQTIFDIRRVAYDQRISGKPLVNGHRTSGFGYRTDPITGRRVEHRGLDFSGPVGEPILALADGIVTFSGENSGYGNLVEIEHVDGLRTRYAHNQDLLVKSGKRVKKGEMIATLGSTGRSTGPHVHIEVRLDGSPIDPSFFIR